MLAEDKTFLGQRQDFITHSSSSSHFLMQISQVHIPTRTCEECQVISAHVVCYARETLTLGDLALYDGQ